MYVNVYVPKSGQSDVPKSDVYKYSDPSRGVAKSSGRSGRERGTKSARRAWEQDRVPQSPEMKARSDRREGVVLQAGCGGV